MVAIYICSTETCAGKTTLAIGLAREFARNGSKVAYFKPISVSEPDLNGDRVDADAVFAKQVLSLSESPEVLSPVTLSADRRGTASAEPEISQRIKDSFVNISRERDVVIAEGPQALDGGVQAGMPANKAIEMLGAKVLLVVRYRGETTLRKVIEATSFLTHQPAGIVINAVPNEQLSYARKSLVPELQRYKVPFSAILPLEKALLGASVGELAGYLGGEVLCCRDSLDKTIESVMIGARSFNSGLPYFSRKDNKAIVTGADRPDIQLAALETSTRCIVVTGGKDPDAIVVERAKEVRVPLIKVAEGTIETLDRIAQFLAGARFRQADKARTVAKLIEANLNLGELSAALGVPQRQ